MVNNLGEKNSIANEFLGALRHQEIQTDRPRFRRNMERLGEIMAYEISRSLTYSTASIPTPLGSSRVGLLTKKPVLVTVLRAGIPYFQGFLNYFDSSDCGFVGAYRDESGTEQITVNLEYMAAPSLEGQDLILIDPMLATGQSLVRAMNALKKNGNPSHVHVASLVSTPAGIDYIRTNMKCPFTIWTFAIDEKLNSQFYIVPGLGDAGDLSFGNKI